jgi:hypothetical protein
MLAPKKVVIGTAMKMYGFIFNYLDGVDASSDESDN